MNWILLSICVVLVGATEKVNKQIVNKNVERNIDLSSQLVKITTNITLENTGKNSISNFLVALEPDVSGSLSYISVKDALKEELKLVPTTAENHEGKAFNVHMKQPVANGRSATFSLQMVFTNSLKPYPSSITQKEKQLVRYFGNHYFYTPYHTKKQMTTVTLSSQSPESHSKLKPYAVSDSTITYGPYADVPGFSKDALMVHCKSNSPFLMVTRLERLIEVSHWGNIAVEENIEILHVGAELKGSFSRYDYQRDTSSSHHSVKSYKTILPAAAFNIYYRDSNGNISTSHTRVHEDWIELELRPRFPLFGGWRSSYTIGYNVPSHQYLYRVSGNEFVLNMRLLDHIFDDMHVEELETSIVLPVGVTNVKIKTPYDVQRLDDGITYKFLDNLGRIVLKIKKGNLVEQHIQDVEITYNWQSLRLFYEPILLAIALYILFIFVIIYVRLDFTIYKPEHNKKD